MLNCNEPFAGRRKLFWATQPNDCGVGEDCGKDCGSAGLEYKGDMSGRTISTDNWIRGLAINMLMTDGRSLDTECGYRPGSQGGHWSSSYIEGRNPEIGSLIRTIQPHGTINELTSLVQSYATACLSRLISRGVALDVTVDVTYVGSGKFTLSAEIIGVNRDLTKVGISGQRLENGWVWET